MQGRVVVRVGSEGEVGPVPGESGEDAEATKVGGVVRSSPAVIICSLRE